MKNETPFAKVADYRNPHFYTDMTERKRGLPDWAARERQSDLEWIRENFHVFWPAAIAAFAELGRGALIVDTTSRPTGEGHPFAFIPQETLEQTGDEDVMRMVGEYEPTEDFVVVLLKQKGRTSTYRVHIPPKLP